MRHLLIAAVCMIASPVAAETVVSGFFQFPQVPGPTSMTWQIVNYKGPSMSATVDFPVAVPFDRYAVVVRRANANEYGIDFDAWEAALNDPDYLYSRITFGGLTDQMDILRLTNHLKLDWFVFQVSEWYYPPRFGLPRLTASVTVGPDRIVPEPATWLLTIIVACGVLTMRRSAFRSTSR